MLIRRNIMYDSFSINKINIESCGKIMLCYAKNTSCDSKWVIYVFHPIRKLQHVGQSTNFRAHMNGHKSDFRLYAAGKPTKMDNKLLYDQLIYHNIDYFQVCIIDLIHAHNNKERQP